MLNSGGARYDEPGDLFVGAALDERRDEVADGRSVVSVIGGVDHVCGRRLCCGGGVPGEETADDLIDQELL